MSIISSYISPLLHSFSQNSSRRSPMAAMYSNTRVHMCSFIYIYGSPLPLDLPLSTILSKRPVRHFHHHDGPDVRKNPISRIVRITKWTNSAKLSGSISCRCLLFRRGDLRIRKTTHPRRRPDIGYRYGIPVKKKEANILSPLHNILPHPRSFIALLPFVYCFISMLHDI